MAVAAARLVLHAVQLATDADVHGLRNLVGHHGDVFSAELVLRILLTYLPESTEPSNYVWFLQEISSGDRSASQNLSDEPNLPEELGEDEIEHRAAELRLLAFRRPPWIPDNEADPITLFLLNRARRIDAESGSILHVQQLLEPFAEHSQILAAWIAAVLLPLLRLEYEYYPSESPAYSLRKLESLRGLPGLHSLLSEIFKRNNGGDHRGRDFRGVLGPWIYGQAWGEQQIVGSADGSLAEGMFNEMWAGLNQWLLDHASRNVGESVSVLQQWDGPQDVDLGGWIDWSGTAEASMGYAQCLLAFVYLPSKVAPWPPLEQRRQLLQKASVVSSIDLELADQNDNFASLTSTLSQDFMASITSAHLNLEQLLQPINPVTTPSSESLQLAALLLQSVSLLESLQELLWVEAVFSLALFGFEADQRTRLQKLLRGLLARNIANDTYWRDAREKLLWLHRWRAPEQSSRQGVFGLLGGEEIETEILKAFVTAGRYKLAISTYIQEADVLPRDKVEKCVLDVVFSSYDNASNGNKTRGGIKKASDILTTFRGEFPESLAFQQAGSLIKATHSLSFYSLTLQHGVACLPVNIRAQSRPLSLIDKVLAQNPRSYTKLDDLIDIGRNLYNAGPTIPVREDRTASQGGNIALVERQITAKAIEAALTEDDFDTAYSYVVNRLSTANSADEVQPGSGDDILWKAAYQAGRYQPGNKRGPSQLRRLEQRMELLSQALLLAPASSLPEVLGTWRTCEQDLNGSIAQEVEEEERWNDRGDRRIPGGFTGDDMVPTLQQPREATRKAMNEGAPMGLFDVARGAAAALSKSAFPLRAPGSDRGMGDSSVRSSTEHQRPDSDDGEGRIRKRDMVSSMVTGGLASGIGWVLGAPPVRHE